MGLAPLLSGDAVRHGLRRERQERHAVEFLRPPELRRLLEACERHDRESRAAVKAAPYVLLLLLSGMRSTEQRLLAWSEVDLDAREIRLPASRTKTKAARTIDLRICPTAVDLLARLRLRVKGERVFPDWTPGRLEVAVRRLSAKYGAPEFTPHALRRSCGTLLTCAPGIYNAASCYLSARRLGHAVDVAERSYLGVLTIDAKATTIEAAAGIEDIARRIAGGDAAKSEAVTA